MNRSIVNYIIDDQNSTFEEKASQLHYVVRYIDLSKVVAGDKTQGQLIQDFYDKQYRIFNASNFNQ
ncbi:MAG: hypothetical protein HAW67_00775 [Endozoicomonadaceae bacterium]|nr:hypothetical protein [Endozoicomonadaceae bacterium]